MKKFFLTLGFISTVAVAQDAVRNAKAAELVLHRLEKLNLLGRVDVNHANLFSGLEIEAQTGGEAAFVTLTRSISSPDKPASIRFYSQADGKVLKNETTDGNWPDFDAPLWENVDPVTLAENALHFVLENSDKKPELLPFFNDLKALTIRPAQNSAGKKLAEVVMESKSTSQKLTVYVSAQDGSFDSHKL